MRLSRTPFYDDSSAALVYPEGIECLLVKLASRGQALRLLEAF